MALKFRYYIVRPEMGEVKGTNDIDVAEQFSQDDSNYVIDIEEAQQISMDTVDERFDIEAYKAT